MVTQHGGNLLGRDRYQVGEELLEIVGLLPARPREEAFLVHALLRVGALQPFDGVFNPGGRHRWTLATDAAAGHAIAADINLIVRDEFAMQAAPLAIDAD